MIHLTADELHRIAEQHLKDSGFLIEYTPEVKAEISAIEFRNPQDNPEDVKDLRHLLWSSIDNESSRDLDQIEYAEQLENGDIKILVGIADVDHFVPKNSAIDQVAARNCFTVYTEAGIFPMLPVELSTNLTSLLPDVDRLAVITEIIVGENGDVRDINVYRALTHNRAKLSYERTGAWLDGKDAEPAEFSAVEGLREQILLQQKAAERLYKLRKYNGALEFETIESQAVKRDNLYVDLRSVPPNSAQNLIENFMIAANVGMAKFLESKNFASIRRVVKTPARWDGIREIARKFGETLPEFPDSRALAAFLQKRKLADKMQFPDLSLSIIKLLGAGEYVVQKPGEETDGHFGLAVRDYAHSTAPNRRYADLIVQRLVKAAVKNEPSPYSVEELETIAARCNERESAARKIERLMRKIIAADVMRKRIGKTFRAVVTGVKPVGTFARILRPPVDGRIVKNEENLHVGEQIFVKLIDVDVEKGFIDFAATGN